MAQRNQRSWLKKCRTDVLTRRDYQASLGWNSTFSTRVKWRSSPSASQLCARKALDTATLSERRFITNFQVMHNSDSDSESNYRSKREPQIIVRAIVEIDVVANFKS
jgi:hypothetical protein